MINRLAFLEVRYVFTPTRYDRVMWLMKQRLYARDEIVSKVDCRVGYILASKLADQWNFLLLGERIGANSRKKR